MEAQTNMKQNMMTWTIWIDNIHKTVWTKETPNTKSVCFSNISGGMETVMKLLSKGYKLG